jgi:hypothetical protein
MTMIAVIVPRSDYGSITKQLFPREPIMLTIYTGCSGPAITNKTLPNAPGGK